ncbi:flagellar assembly protein FliW [Nitratidesulfovibrio sp. 1201_IL3209]|uniref:flagellar assembly protein FliW n=1 Tax=Nitratidesulfovibrio sp. 1201_IL3209 TaxID=3084053 RepID=UPI002FD976A4
MARQNERVIQTRLGRQKVALDKVLYFPRGLMGFEDRHEFTLLQLREGAPFLILQSMDDPRLGLLVGDPYSFLDDYPIRVGDAEQKLLRLRTIRQVAVLVTVSIPPGRPEKTALNLTGPILINHEARLGLQVPQTDGRFPTQYYLHEQGGCPAERAPDCEDGEDKDADKDADGTGNGEDGEA